jgi:hypothetical protein
MIFHDGKILLICFRLLGEKIAVFMKNLTDLLFLSQYLNKIERIVLISTKRRVGSVLISITNPGTKKTGTQQL